MVKTRDLNQITFHKDPWKQRAVARGEKKIYGWDTETQNGYAFLLSKCDSNGIPNSYPISSFNDFISAAFHKGPRQGINWFYNLEFDFTALCKHLGFKKLEELSKTGFTTFQEYDLQYIPKKCFIIQKRGSTRQSLKFYDCLQFYKLSLKEAAKIVNLEKLDFNTGAIDYEEYKRNGEYTKQLVSYALQDAKICQKLGERLFNACNLIIPIHQFYSTASIAQQYFLTHLPHNLRSPSKAVMDIALKSYNGGRFELVKRGHFNNVSEIDINSAYPYEISQLIETDTDTGKWVNVKEEYNPEAIYGFYEIETETHGYLLSPILHRIKNIICYPHGKHHAIVEASELKIIDKLGFKYKILNGVEYFDSNPVYPFTFIHELYNERLKMKKEGKDDLQYVLKIIMNSGYGKMIQLVPNLTLHKDITAEQMDEEETFEIESDSGEKIYAIKNGFKAGKMFNPVFASAITARVRSNLLNTVIKYKLEDNLIGFATDCMYLKGNAPQALVGEGLGAWKLEVKETEGLFVGSGVYALRCYRNKKDCFITKDGICKKHDKNHLRGFNTRYQLFTEILNNYSYDKKGVKFDFNGPIKLKEGLRGGKVETDKGEIKVDWEDIGKFITKVKFMDLNFDKKRKWDYEVNGPNDLMNNEINSIPLVI